MGLQLCLSEGGDLSAYDWNPIMQTILILSCFLAAASSLHLLHPLFLHPSSGYGLNQAHPGGGSSFQHVSRLHKRLKPIPTTAISLVGPLLSDTESNPLSMERVPMSMERGAQRLTQNPNMAMDSTP